MYSAMSLRNDILVTPRKRPVCSLPSHLLSFSSEVITALNFVFFFPLRCCIVFPHLNESLKVYCFLLHHFEVISVESFCVHFFLWLASFISVLSFWYSPKRIHIKGAHPHVVFDTSQFVYKLMGYFQLVFFYYKQWS